MKMFQSTVAVCLALICVTVAMAEVTEPCDQSCDDEQLIYEADLKTRQSVSDEIYDSDFIVQVIPMPSQPTGLGNAPRSLKVTFPPATESGVQKWRLKLVMEMASPPLDSASLGDYSFRVADDERADGASVEVFNENQDLVNPIDTRVGVIQPGHTFEVIIGDEYLSFGRSNTEYCDADLLFALRGQSSPESSAYDVYIAFNTPISGSTPDSEFFGVRNVKMLALTCE